MYKRQLDEDEFSDFDNYLEDNFDIDRMCGDGNHLTEDMMPEGSSVSITHDEETGIQTMGHADRGRYRRHGDDDTPP